MNDHDPSCDRCHGRGYISDGRLEDGMLTGRMACPGYGWREVPRPRSYDIKTGPSSDPYDVEQRLLRGAR